MASDGVLFKFLSKVHPRFQTPLIATLIAGTFGGFMAAIFNLDDLINMMSIGTLTAYTLVAVCVLCLRYRKDTDGADDTLNLDLEKEYSSLTLWKKCLNYQGTPMPTFASSSFTDRAVTIFCVVTLAFCGVAIQLEDHIADLKPAGLIPIIGLGLILIFIMISLSMQPVSRVKLTFKVPLVPYLPGISIIANTYLILKLSWETWIRFAVWMAIGFIFYAVCLLNGTTDKAYQQSVEKRQRKFSKISTNGFNNAMFQGSSGSMQMQQLGGATASREQQGSSQGTTETDDYPTSLTNRWSTYLQHEKENGGGTTDSSMRSGNNADKNKNEILTDDKNLCCCYYDNNRNLSQEEGGTEQQPQHKIHCPKYCTDNLSGGNSHSGGEGEGDSATNNEEQQGKVENVAQQLVDSVIDRAHSHVEQQQHKKQE